MFSNSFFFLIINQGNTFDWIEGKRLQANLSDAYTWLAVADSHFQFLLPFLAKFGVSGVAISGGQIWHMKKYLECHNFFKGRVNGIFIFAGGNDIARREGALTKVVGDMKDLVLSIAKVNNGCTIVTNTFIPRATGRDGGDGFLSLCERVDGMISQWSVKHHHVLNNVMVADKDRYGKVGIRSELYGRDLTHLNGAGRKAYEQVLEFIFDSVNRDDFKGRREIPCGDSYRTVLWKF